jgi:hypothetical protein
MMGGKKKPGVETISTAKRKEEIHFLLEFVQTKVPIPHFIQKKPRKLQKGYPINGIEHPSLESVFIFCIVWGMTDFLHPKALNKFQDFLEEKINKYLTSFKESRMTAFANNLVKILKEGKHPPKFSLNQEPKQIWDFCFDITHERWILWKDIKIPDYPIITPNLEIYLNYTELARLNPLLSDINSLKKFHSEREVQVIPLPSKDEQIFIHTEKSNKYRFFLDYLIAYNRGFIITSPPCSGKTAIIKYKLKRMLEQNIYKVISLAAVVHTKPESVKTQNNIPNIIASCIVLNLKQP